MATNQIQIVPPLKGYVEVYAYAAQPEGTSPDMRNVFLLDPESARFRVSQRPGTGLYDLFNFNTGTAVSSPVTLPSHGQIVEAGPIINVPMRGCWDATDSTGNLDIITTGTPCTTAGGDPGVSGPGTVQIGSPTNNTGSPVTGSVTITGPGGTGGGIGWTIPPVSSGTPTNDPQPVDPARPYLSLKNCDGGGFLDGGGVSQDVLGVFNALPVIQIGDECFQVTGQRISKPSNVVNFDTGTTFRNCEDCTGATGKSCYYIFRSTYDCLAETPAWSTPTLNRTSCLLDTSVASPNGWITVSTVGSVTTDEYYAKGDSCTTSATCTSTPSVPAAPTAAPDCSSDYWFCVYTCTVSCAGVQGPITYKNTVCQDASTVPEEDAWVQTDTTVDSVVFEYWHRGIACVAGGTAPDPCDPPTDGPGDFVPYDCGACQICDQMLIMTGSEILGIKWDITSMAYMMTCPTFASAAVFDDPTTEYFWDGVIPVGGPDGSVNLNFGSITAGDMSGTITLTCPGSPVTNGELVVRLGDGGTLSLAIIFALVTGSNGNIICNIQAVEWTDATPSVPGPRCVDDSEGHPVDSSAGITGTITLVNNCCFGSDGSAKNGTPNDPSTVNYTCKA